MSAEDYGHFSKSGLRGRRNPTIVRRTEVPAYDSAVGFLRTSRRIPTTLQTAHVRKDKRPALIGQ